MMRKALVVIVSFLQGCFLIFFIVVFLFIFVYSRHLWAVSLDALKKTRTTSTVRNQKVQGRVHNFSRGVGDLESTKCLSCGYTSLEISTY